MLTRSTVIRIVLALVLPFMIFAPLFVLAEELRYVFPQAFGPATSVLWVLSALAGFALVAKPFLRYAVVIGVVYFPVMLGLLFYFALFLAGHLYGDFL